MGLGNEYLLKLAPVEGKAFLKESLNADAKANSKNEIDNRYHAVGQYHQEK